MRHTSVLSLRVSNEVIEVIQELISMGLAENKSQAANLLMKIGIREAREMIRRRKRVLELVERYKREGVPYELPVVSDLLEERE